MIPFDMKIGYASFQNLVDFSRLKYGDKLENPLDRAIGLCDSVDGAMYLALRKIEIGPYMSTRVHPDQPLQFPRACQADPSKVPDEVIAAQLEETLAILKRHDKDRDRRAMHSGEFFSPAAVQLLQPWAPIRVDFRKERGLENARD